MVLCQPTGGRARLTEGEKKVAVKLYAVIKTLELKKRTETEFVKLI